MTQQKSQQQTEIIPNPNPTQMYVMERFSRAMGLVYTVLEGALPVETQYTAVKKQLNTILYDFRNEMLRYFQE